MARRRPPRRRETGIALVFVLVALAVVAMVAVAYVVNTRHDEPHAEPAPPTTTTTTPEAPAGSLRAAGLFIAFPAQGDATVSRNEIVMFVPEGGGTVTGSWAIGYEGAGGGSATDSGELEGEYDPATGVITDTTKMSSSTPRGTSEAGKAAWHATVNLDAGTVKGRIDLSEALVFEARIDERGP